MPIYQYQCKSCEFSFEKRLSLSEYDIPQPCEECSSETERIVQPVGFVLVGDDWAGKNIRIKNQMAAKNRRLDAKQNEIKRDAPSVRLAPNVDGERVDSWSDAQKLAASKGKNTDSYEKKIAEERKG